MSTAVVLPLALRKTREILSPGTKMATLGKQADGDALYGESSNRRLRFAYLRLFPPFHALPGPASLAIYFSRNGKRCYGSPKPCAHSSLERGILDGDLLVASWHSGARCSIAPEGVNPFFRLIYILGPVVCPTTKRSKGAHLYYIALQ